MEGKPMIVIPKAFDQPAVAARLKWYGVAEVLSMKELSANRILGALKRILNEPGYRDSAMKLRVAIRSSCGLEHAADVIEESLRRHAVTQGTLLNGRSERDGVMDERDPACLSMTLE